MVDALGDMLVWQGVSKRLAERYAGGVSLLFPLQQQRLDESAEHAMAVMNVLNDHLDWLAYLQEPKGKKQTMPVVSLDCETTSKRSRQRWSGPSSRFQSRSLRGEGRGRALRA